MKSFSFDQSIWQKGLHILTLFTLAVAHPLFDLTARHPSFFVARKSEPLEIVLLVAVLCFLIPGLLVLTEWLLGHRRIGGRIFHGIVLFLLCAAVILPGLKKTTDIAPGWFIPLTILACVALTLIYFRFANFRNSITFLCPILLIVPFLFLNHSRINRIVWPSQDRPVPVSIRSTYPVVIVVFDEFPLKSLLDENGNIDAERYPHFDELSRTATWYRNATTVAGDTIQAIPAILTGNYPKPLLLPNRTDYPQNLLSLLEGTFTLKIEEFLTGFSQTRRAKRNRETFAEKIKTLLGDLTAIYLHHILPPDQIKRLPVITQTWGNFWEKRQPHPGMSQETTTIDQRARKFRRFIKSISKSEKPGFYFLHTMLPHVPWNYFPSGNQYNPKGIGYFGVDGLTKYETWIKEPAVREHAVKRHLLQVAFVDRLLGELVHHLKRERLWEKSVFIVVSDHGTSFDEGRRRAITETNFQDIMRVPLFIKAPSQKNGEISDVNAQVIDIFPTIQSILDIDSGWKFDGHSLLNASETSKRKTFISSGRELQFPATPPLLTGFDQTDPVKIAMTPDPEWLGKSLSDLPYGGESLVEVHLHNSEWFRDVKPESGFLPALITAHMPKQNFDRNETFGIVVNGIIRATAHPFQFDPKLLFLSSVVPETSFRSGINEVEIILFSKNRKKEYFRPRLIQDKGQPVLDYSGKSF